MEILGYLASVLIGVSLGLIGGGGSILTVPILVYLFGVDPKLATSYSLFVVGLSAAIGSYRHYRIGNLQTGPAFTFALPSLFTLLVVRKAVLPRLPEILFSQGGFTLTRDVLIMGLFAILMVAASWSMVRKGNSAPNHTTISPTRLALVGAAVGIVTGFLGAGGGFLIIPALLFFARMDMKQAVGTSLSIIALNSLVGFASDVAGGVVVDLQLLLTVSMLAVLGIWMGTRLSHHIDGAKLKPAFGWFVLVMGIYILTRELLMR